MRPKLVQGTVIRPGRLRHDLAKYGAAIGMTVALSAVQVFVIPRRLDVPTYGQYRLFLLFVNYFGLVQFGLSEGAFLRWAGRPSGEIAWEWRRIARWMLTLQLVIVGVAAAISLFAEPLIRTYILAVTACALCVNMNALCAYALQAAGDFKRAGRAVALAPGLFVGAVVLFSLRTLPGILGAYVGSFLIAALYGVVALSRFGVEKPSARAAFTIRQLTTAGLPVLVSSIAAGLSQSVDRLLVSASTPITTFALYGFAGTAAVAANSAVQALSRVALSHAAHRTPADRARFLGGFLHVIAVGYGVCLALEPVFEQMVTRYLPLYAAALPILRAFTVGLPVWVALRVVLVSTLQAHGHVRRQLAVESIGVALVALMSGAVLFAHRELWQVAAGSSVAAVLTFIATHAIVRHAERTASDQQVFRFLCTIAVQGGALLVALLLAPGWPIRCLAYIALSSVPTAIAAFALRRHDWPSRPSAADLVTG